MTRKTRAHRPHRGLVAALFLVALVVPATVHAGGFLAMVEASLTSDGPWEPAWTIDSAGAADNGPASGTIQEHVYGKIVKFEATLANQTTVPIDGLRLQMDTTSDVLVVRNGDYLEWYLGTTRLSCDSQRWTEGLPTEFFADLAGSGSIKVMQANTSTFVQVESVHLEVDTDDVECP